MRRGEVQRAGRRVGVLGPSDCAASHAVQPLDQRLLGTDHDEADLGLPREVDDSGLIVERERHQRGMVADPGIARRSVQCTEQRRLRELPGERMFAAPRAQQQDIHGRPLRTL